jgi:DNA mismatch endonuclease (patch repair protein)
VTDVVDSKTRSRMMSGIRAKDTKPELVLRKALHARGFRYRLHDRSLAGRPDLVLPRYRAVVLIHGCFWHQHEGCRYATSPSTRPDFWQAKFDANRRRDAEVFISLTEQGWRVATIWECALRRSTQASATSELVADWLTGGAQSLEM